MTQGCTGFLTFSALTSTEQSNRIHQELQVLKDEGNSKVSCWLAEADAAQVSRLQDIASELDMELVGAIFPAVIYQGELHNEGCLIKPLPRNTQSLLIRCQNSSAAPDTITDKSPAEIAEELAQLPIPANALRPNLFLIFDAQQPNISDILDQLYLTLHNSVRYCGTNAGSETFQPMPCLFDNTSLIGMGFWALLFDTPFDNALAHGYKNFEPITATSTTGNRIHSINWRNAFEVYQEEIASRFQQTVTAENFYDFATHFPFGIMRMSGQPLVRIPVAVETDGTLVCVGDIPEHTVISLLQGVEADGSETLDLLAKQLKTTAPDYQVFYCAGRRMHLGEETQQELQQLTRRFSNSNLSGALSLGEICNDDGQGYPLFHNAAIVCCPWV